MNVLIVSPYQTVNPHFETELEIAQRHLCAGDKVATMSCTGQLSICDFNITGDRSVCQQCQLRRQMGHRQLSHHLPILPACERKDHVLPEPIQLFLSNLTQKTLADLKALKHEDFDIGYASLSSLVSSLRQPSPDLVENRERITALISNALAVYRSVKRYLQQNAIDRVYVFNGRFAEMRAVLRAAQTCGVDCMIHERGSTHNRFQLFKNHLPHDIDYMKQRMIEFWNAADQDLRVKSARQWFADRRQRVERNWKSFTKEQQQNLLPESWNPQAYNLVLFCSSEDEFAAIGDSWDQRPYPSQLAGVQHLLSLLRRSDARLTVRLHPNLKDAPASLTEPFLQLRHPQLDVITPDSPIDSYALLDAADVCLSYGSSVGIEAVYQQKPSILLGPCFYRDLGGTYQPLRSIAGDARRLDPSDDRVVQLQQQLNESLSPLPDEGALIYAYWMQENGIEYRHYQGDQFNEGKFNGVWIYPEPNPKSLKRKVMRWAEHYWKAAPHFLRSARNNPKQVTVPSGLQFSSEETGEDDGVNRSVCILSCVVWSWLKFSGS